MLFILAAATGRAGELPVWRSDAHATKTQNAYRIVDLHPDVAKLLSGFVGDRESGDIFCTSWKSHSVRATSLLPCVVLSRRTFRERFI